MPVTEICEAVTKPVPDNVNVNADDPAAIVAGDGAVMAEIAGIGFVTVKVAAVLTPPPGDGLATVTLTVPAPDSTVAGIVAESTPLVSTVVSGTPATLIADVARKPVPFTVIVADVPATGVVGLTTIDVITGDGLSTTRLVARLAPPPGAGLVTITLSGVAVVARVEGTVADKVPSTSNTVVRLVPPTEIVEAESKPVPVRIIGVVAPSNVLVGDIAVIAGAGLDIVNVLVAESVPCIVCVFETTTFTVRAVVRTDAGIVACSICGACCTSVAA